MPLRSDALPSRTALPRDARIPVLPALGDTWYDRGLRYWARRAGITLMWVVVLAGIGSIDYGLFSGIRQSSRAGFAVFLTVVVVLTAALLVYFAVRTVRYWNTPALPGEIKVVLPFSNKGAVLNGAGRFIRTLGVWVVMIIMLVFPGLYIVMFLTSLMPEMPNERHARLWMASRLRERGYQVPAA